MSEPATSPEPRHANLLERGLALFAPVRAGEGLVAVALLVTVFLILSAYYVLKTAREGLILTGGMLGLRGEELKIYASAATAAMLVGIVPAYGALASRVRRIRLINISYLVIIGMLVMFAALGRAGVPIGLAFYLWLGVVNMFVIAQFWSYANDLYTEEQGKRLFAVIALGGSIGAVVGPRLASVGDTYTLLLLSAAMLVVCVVLFNAIDAALAGRAHRTRSTGEAPMGRDGGFALVMRDRYLLLIALMLIVANLVNSAGEFILSRAATESVAGAPEEQRRELIKAFYGDFFFWVNLCGFLIQALLVSRVVAYAGVRAALLVMPMIALAGYGAIGLVGGIAVTRLAKIAENSIDYSLQNTVRHTLFLPTSRAVKYKAKAAIDTFFVRTGDALAAVLVAISIHVLDLGPRTLALVNTGLISLWLLIALGVGRGYRRLSAAA